MGKLVAAALAASLLSCLVACMVGDAPDDGAGVAGSSLSADDTGDTGGFGMLARTCAAGATTPGIDVSYYQGTIDWSRVAAAGTKFAFIRVSDGTTFHDPKFDSYWTGSKNAGLIRGAQLHVMRGAGHLMLIDEPRPAGARIRQFLEE